MIHNALINLPIHSNSKQSPDKGDGWKVQLFVNEQWAEDNLLPWHPGLERLFQGEDSRVIVTPLPVSLTKGKPKEVLFSKWFWENMAADRVVLFTGNGAFCGNQPSGSAWKELLELDYCGAPSHSNRHRGVGGDGSSHSIRSRNAMLRVIEYAAQQESEETAPALRDEQNFVDIMLRINQKHPGTFQLATPDQTIQFGGVFNLSSADGLVRLPLAVAGTQAKLTYEERDSLLKHCPELKTIFPSLHEPACFGAHPNAAKCKATICALQDNIPGHGC